MRATIDRCGRIAVPKKIRERLGIKPGVVLKIHEYQDHIVMRPEQDELPLKRKEGLLVYVGTATGEMSAAVKKSRLGRLRNVFKN
ncbi:MAG: AbrB/MazE/SpoVT family DNA-binding domain-containing protein [Nitrospirota bacterium]